VHVSSPITKNLHPISLPDDTRLTSLIFPDNRALTLLNVSNNSIASEEARVNRGNELKSGELVEHDGVMCPVSAHWGTGYCVYLMHGVIALADAIKDMRALTSLHVGQNGIPQKEMREIIAIAMGMDSMKILCEVPFKDKTLSEVDISRKNLGREGALVIAEYLDGNGALSIANVIGNRIGKPMLSELQQIMRSKPNLLSLCGIADDATEANLSGLMDADDVVILASELPAKRVLTLLNLSSNSLKVKGAKIIAEAVKVTFGTIFMPIGPQ
jgi:Leucine-rich repeat (LRR) protein